LRSFKRSYPETDSMIYIDSAAVLSASRGDNDFQNIDQMIYLHHFGRYLPRKSNSDMEELKRRYDEEEDPLIQDEEEAPKKKKKGLFGFMKKKRNRSEEAATDEDHA
jgi:hypothetical protein